MGEIDLSLVNWSRAQFALTALYHWIFVPLTLGLSFLCAFFETIYVKTGREEWKNITKFWMTLFGINFAIGVATGIILEFQFGTNWSNYSWMVGDIFGAPLAIEGILAFFLEATFFAVMFFGWNRISRGSHLFATWMVAVGSSLSALWILVANGWMQHPVGMAFNPDTVRFEMQNFWEVLLSPVAIAKFTHTTASSFMVGSLFIITVSSWYLLKNRHTDMAKKSIIVASVFGLLGTGYTAFTGDESGFANGHTQPMKLAAYEGLFNGQIGTPIVAFGIPNAAKRAGDSQEPFLFEISIPKGLSLLANRDINSFVPGINDLVYGNAEQNIMGVEEKMVLGKQAVNSLLAYKEAKKTDNKATAQIALEAFRTNQNYLGYGYLQKAEEAVPPVALTFYTFHIMVFSGVAIGLLFLLFLITSLKGTLMKKRWLLRLGVPSFFLGIIASESGWIVAEVGRQPWAIQDLMPVSVATTNIGVGHVQASFFIFLIIFTALLIAEVKIMLKQIKIGPEGV
ncbi:cytochrome ubiquinol oxidase subunit I [Desulfotalea psychrophila]|uniref:Probable cytochrome D ubiquinol oxidase, subunit I n=1 Tax=Desulfotalea psychrophila (strain LSv54 / DSM 12343) TaxID=177439 RepID=Q6APR9_DESPS|nr:cytochrome ubiquinol oxidase subunit I [Desulfotalea psychrophila]CAG35655.1 probable cytochrome D ubiquinol oxidase, subunit I [Desulfotalea psychrophila LSv54]